MTITTTLNNIRAKKPCADVWKKLLTGLGKTRADDKPLTFSRILEINGIVDAVWCVRAEPQHAKEWRLFAVWCARQVEHLLTDQRSLEALNIAERHAHGLATDEELAAASDAAWAAASDAASDAAVDAASAIASDAAWTAAMDAAWAAARADASEDAWAVAKDAQKVKLLEITGGNRRITL